MPKYCSVNGCRTKYGQGIILRHFPRDAERNKKWKKKHWNDNIVIYVPFVRL